MRIALAIAVGVLSWSFLEYLLHRFLGHHRRFMPNFFSAEHTRHHSVGDYFAPAAKKAPAAVVILAVAVPLSWWLVGARLGIAYSVSFVVMYLVYEVVHRRAHTHPGYGPYARYLRRHHFHHHFANPRANHGVTSPIWDLVFGTYEAAHHIRVPAKLQMRWLADEDGKVRARFASRYSIV